MTHKDLVKSILKNLQLSTMEHKEKAMWTVMLPTMNEEELTKLNTVLEEEVDAIMDLYFAKNA